ncbi:hypothetical protein Scep_021214 [Stephania cephalantha]|uniref:Uncharacterized protein n=1 Tax=Stephania cephalantha TaxID=152367 RepID=A0AAP0I1B9_9MAGN
MAEAVARDRVRDPVECTDRDSDLVMHRGKDMDKFQLERDFNVPVAEEPKLVTEEPKLSRRSPNFYDRVELGGVAARGKTRMVEWQGKRAIAAAGQGGRVALRRADDVVVNATAMQLLRWETTREARPTRARRGSQALDEDHRRCLQRRDSGDGNKRKMAAFHAQASEAVVAQGDTMRPLA